MKLNINDILNIIQNFISDNIIIISVAIALIAVSTIIVNIKIKKRETKKKFDINHNDPLLVNKEISNKEEIQLQAFNLLKDLKIAKMNFDLDKIKTITTTNIYELYKTQIETLKTKQQKNISEQIEYVKSYITNTTNNDKIINLRIVIKCFDYIVDKKNTIIKGKYNRKILQTYEIEIINNNSNYIIQKLELLYEREI